MTAEPSALVSTSRDRIPALDALRGIAMLAVVGCHLIWPGALSQLDWLDRILVNGWIGVDLFFVLSGFLITGILIDARGESRYFWNFYARRALRIFPVYYLFLVGLFVGVPLVLWLTDRATPLQFAQVAAHGEFYWTYTVNILQARYPVAEWFHTGHLWSLSVEEQFYLVWPALVLFTPRRRLPLACIVASLAGVLLRAWWVLTHGRLLGAYVLTPLRIDAFAVGALIASLARTPDGTALLRRWYRRVGFAALGVAAPIQIAFGANLQHRLVVLVGYAANAIVFSALIAWLLDDARPRRSLERRWLQKIGRISYGGYLYHVPLIALCVPLRSRIIALSGDGLVARSAAHAIWIGGMIGLTLMVASISHRWFETPFLRRKERFVAAGPPIVGSTPGGREPSAIGA